MSTQTQYEYSTGWKVVIWSLRTLVNTIYLPILFIRLFKQSKKCPPIHDQTLLLPASELAKRIRKKQITSVAVVQAYISRINEVNPFINAVLEDRFQDALQDARRADDMVQNSGLTEDQLMEKYPLLGVPITIKGSIALTGMTHSAGRVDHKVIAKVDGAPVGLAKQAGAIPLLTSSVPELCLNWETQNKLIGTTANPYDTCRTPGGSSGGEASLLGCGASLIGIGSDIAGSLRLPAHCCGVWGHKPTAQAVSILGHYPDCKDREDWNKVFAQGPMARYASDLKLLMNVIAEPDLKNVLKLDEPVEVRKIKVYYMKDSNSPVSNRVDSDVTAAIDKVVTHFNFIGQSKCTQIAIPLMKFCSELSYLRLLDVDDVENVFPGRGDGVYTELFRFLTCQSKHEFTSICYGLLRRNLHLVPSKTVKKVYTSLEDLRNHFLKILGDDGVYITPISPHEATYQGDAFRGAFDFGYLSIFNALGLPATSCPVAFSKNGLPIGIQVVAGPNLDRLTLSVAEELERAFGGWKFN